MNWTQIEGKWTQLKADAKTQWGKLTDDDLKVVGGSFDNLVGKVVERYGVRKEQAHEQVSAWADRLGEHIDAAARSIEDKTKEEKRDLKSGSQH